VPRNTAAPANTEKLKTFHGIHISGDPHMPIVTKHLPRKLLDEVVTALKSKGFECVDESDMVRCSKPVNEVQYYTYVFMPEG
jgi:hypothetical protein